jgi:16S rRNA G527 N7-methylase RsmG
MKLNQLNEFESKQEVCLWIIQYIIEKNGKVSLLELQQKNIYFIQQIIDKLKPIEDFEVFTTHKQFRLLLTHCLLELESVGIIFQDGNSFKVNYHFIAPLLKSVKDKMELIKRSNENVNNNDILDFLEFL